MSIAVTGDLKLSWFWRGLLEECSSTSPGRNDGYEGNRPMSSILHSSFDGMKLACGPIMEVMK